MQRADHGAPRCPRRSLWRRRASAALRCLRRSVNLVMGREHVAQRRRAHDTARQDLCNMIQYVLTYYPNVGASKRETANGGTATGPRGGARGPRPGAGGGAATSRAALLALILDGLNLWRETN